MEICFIFKAFLTICSLKSLIEAEEKTATLVKREERQISEQLQQRKFRLDSPSFLPNTSQVGQTEQVTTLIFGGEESNPEAFPFAALIGTKPRKLVWNPEELMIPQEVDFAWVCGGTLINLWFVLTAAHCQEEEGGISSVKIGDWRDGEEFDIDPGDVILHESYKKKVRQVDNDIALIRLPRKARVKSLVQIGFLPYPESIVARDLNVRNLGLGLVGKNVKVVGWGYTRYKKNSSGRDTLEFFREAETIPSKTQNYIEVPILNSTECRTTRRPDQFCTEGKGGKSTCRGDGGGGAFLQSNSFAETWYLIGIVSTANRVCGLGHHTVFTRVSNHMAWIRRHLE